ncbi:hypothetical protein, partial [Azohydromonas australica]|uniref:hypothetical protein n=1 Tax=Azohydromonas australica TaxID=364039 RepID=UPI001B7FE0AF
NYDLCFQEVQVEINSWDFYDFLSNFCVSPTFIFLNIAGPKPEFDIYTPLRPAVPSAWGVMRTKGATETRL